MALDWAGFFMSLGVESMPKYGLEVDFMKLYDIEYMFSLQLQF